jgi:hypothetical protein
MKEDTNLSTPNTEATDMIYLSALVKSEPCNLEDKPSLDYNQSFWYENGEQ